jgi:hypothetical protein
MVQLDIIINLAELGDKTHYSQYVLFVGLIFVFKLSV